MHAFDWILFFGFLAYVIADGVRRARRNRDADDYFLAGREMPWWAMGLSIMATQASAITMIGTTGQGWLDGLRFVQFYFALPLAMLILAVTAVPLYHRLRVSTAYEFLGVRFDRKTRLLSAVLFLILRGLSVGFVIYTPSLVLSKVFTVPLSYTILAMGGIAVLYTSIGGLRAVIATDVKQMMVMTLGLVVAFVSILIRIPEDVGWSGAMTLAGEAGRLEWISFDWDPSEKYTIWSSLIGGLFLFLSYFGTDQSQVQRLLSGRSVRHMQGALLLNAVCKVPFQFLVLLCGTLLFVFYLFHEQPLSFEPVHEPIAVSQSGELPQDTRSAANPQGAGSAANPQGAQSAPVRSGEDVGGPSDRDERTAYEDVASRYVDVRAELARVADRVGRGDASPEETARYRDLVATSSELRDEAQVVRGGVGDTNFVFLDFILTYLPVGIVGLLLAAILAAALSSIDSELNAMTTVAVLDVVQFGFRRELGAGAVLRVSRIATLAVGAFATIFALYAGEIGSLIEAVNSVGSYIYGSLLGAFILALGVRVANGHGAFVGLLAGMVVVTAAAQTDLAFLYLNAVGTVTVVGVGSLVSVLTGGRRSGLGRDLPADR